MPEETHHSSQRPLSNEEIVMLSREIQAMIGAGVPLDFGLSLASSGLPDRLEEVSLRLSRELQAGKTLPEALEQEASIPPVYKAVLVAGLQCGRSEEVLEDVCHLTQSLVDLKASIRRGLIYPVIVIGLCLCFMLLIFPRYLQIQLRIYEDSQSVPPVWMQQLLSIETTINNNLASLAMVLVLLVAVWIIFRQRSRRPTLSSGMWWIPGISGVLDHVDLARTTNILALLTKYECPLPAALSLTAQTAESPIRKQRFLKMSADAEQGVSLQDSMQRHQGFPPFLCWLIANGAEGSLLSSSLSQAARFYRTQAATRANLIRIIVPTAAMVIVGGGVTLMYGITVFGPMTQLWEQLAK